MASLLEKIFGSKSNVESLVGIQEPMDIAIATPIEEIEEVKSRKSIKEAKKELLSLLDEFNEENWKEMFQKTNLKINEFINNVKRDFLLLGMDFSLIKEECSFFNTYMIKQRTFYSLQQAKNSIEERIESLKKDIALQINFINIANACIQYGCGLIVYKGDQARFKYHQLSSRNDKECLEIHKIGYVDHSLKDPDDFTRSIPKNTSNLLKKLSRTTYDYNPKILDGYLAFHDTDVKTISSLEYDPALTLDVGGNNRILIDFWKTSEKSLLELNYKVAELIIKNKMQELQWAGYGHRTILEFGY